MNELRIRYLKDRRKEVHEIKDALNSSSYNVIRILAHRARGNAAMYGFPRIGEVAGKLEDAAIVNSHQSLCDYIGEFQSEIENALAQNL